MQILHRFAGSIQRYSEEPRSFPIPIITCRITARGVKQHLSDLHFRIPALSENMSSS
jgi:hypothetical protein